MDTPDLETTKEQQLGITPMGDKLNLMDPYDLFSTPPSDMVLSSTPSKPKKSDLNKSLRNITPKNSGKKTLKPQRTPMQGKAANNLKKGKGKKQKSENLWDKCLKTNPDLAQFVDNFNQSLEEALSKPLDTQ